MHAALAGLLTGLSLIVAIGAQNAYVLRVGLTRTYVATAVAICTGADVVLIVIGTAGIGGVIHRLPTVLDVLRWVGVAFLVGYAILSLARALRRQVLLPSDADRPTRRKVVATTLAFTILNPHVYLDTVLLLGAIANQYGRQRWLFAGGACTASLLWFNGLGFGARHAAGLMSRVSTWRLLDVLIAVVMLTVAASVATTKV